MTATAASISLSQAAKLTGRGKTTLARAIKAGRVSATRNDTGGYQREASELARAYYDKAAADAATGHMANHSPPNATAVALVATADVLVATLREQLADMKKDRDRWRAVAEREQGQRLLPAATPRRSRWW